MCGNETHQSWHMNKTFDQKEEVISHFSQAIIIWSLASQLIVI